jgi:hypothetical protein
LLAALAEKLLEVPVELIRTALDLELTEGTVRTRLRGKFPAIREKNREFRENRRNFEFLVVESDTISIGWNSNSLRNRTGN